MPNRIIYVCATNSNIDRPAGGSRVIYRHVELLARNGYDAIVWNLSKTSHKWFSSEAPTVHGETIEMDASDILVIPQEYALFGIGDPAPGCRKVNFCQSITLIRPGLRLGNYMNWDPWPAVWTVSKTCYDIMTRLADRLPVTSTWLIPLVVDTTQFRPSEPRQLKVAWMPRKRRFQSELFHELLRADKRFSDATLCPIDGMSESQTAIEIGTSSVFVSLPSISEGFGLPPAEALAAGCAVVGYPAGGGQEIFECPGATALHDSDLPSLLDQVAAILSDPPTNEERYKYRQWIKGRYNEQRQLLALVEAIEEARLQPAKAGHATHPGVMSVPHSGMLLGQIIQKRQEVDAYVKDFIGEFC